jgi:hypothetical protein
VAVLAITCLVLRPSIPAASSGESLEVPGGVTAVSRLLGGVDTDPGRFVTSLNRVLLDRVEEEHRADRHPDRRMLLDYLRTTREIAQEFGTEIELTPDAAGGRRLEELARALGYRAERETGRVVLERSDDRDARRRRAVAAALDWDLLAGASRIARGESITFHLEWNHVPVPIDLARWAALLERPVEPSTALADLAGDQRLGLVLEGLERVDRATAEHLVEKHLQWLYAAVPVRFYRYAPALELEENGWRTPGGDDGRELWGWLTRVSPGDPDRFLRALLAAGSGELAYLWHALATAPPETASWLTRSCLEDPEVGNAGAVLRSLDGVREVVRFDRARGLGLGPAATLRALPTVYDGSALAPPGDPGVWLQATQAEAARAARGDGWIPDPRETRPVVSWISEVWRRSHPRAGHLDNLVPRVDRALGFFADHPETFTPTSLALVARISESSEPALLVLDAVDPSSAGVVEVYLRTVMRLERRGLSEADRIVLATFQGGVELVRMLAVAGRVDPAFLEESLVRWSDLHLEERGFDALALAQLGWLESLVGGLPSPEPSASGRGSAEHALLSALAAPRDPQSFEWHGLRYRGRRAALEAERMAAGLADLGVPSPDDLLAIRRLLGAFEEAIDRGDREVFQTVCGELPVILGSQPTVAAGDDSPCVTPDELAPLLDELETVSGAGPVRSARTLVEELESLLRRLAYPFWLAPAYLEALEPPGGNLFIENDLLCRHSLVRDLDAVASTDTPWRRATVVPAAGDGRGAHLAGHLSGVTGALLAFLSPGAGGGLAAAHETLRDGLWYEDAVRTPWREITPEVSAVVSAGLAVGDAVLEEALSAPFEETPWQGILRRVVPTTRLERAWMGRSGGADPRSWISPAERLRIGLEAAGGGRDGRGRSSRVAAAIAAFERARAPLGPDWSAQLEVVGAPSVTIDGRGDRRLGWWPSYEALQDEGPIELLHERELLDLRVTVVDYLGRRSLPGEVGGDVMRRLVSRLPSELELHGPRDWIGFLRWLVALDDDSLDERMRKCLKDGLYVAQGL